MNKRVNQLINQLNLDPKREAAVRELFSLIGGGGSNSADNGPVIIEYPFGSDEDVTLTDEQVNAVKNSNIKIKLTIPGNSTYFIILPELYEISDKVACILVYQPNSEGGISNVVYLVDITNKTITKE